VSNFGSEEAHHDLRIAARRFGARNRMQAAAIAVSICVVHLTRDRE